MAEPTQWALAEARKLNNDDDKPWDEEFITGLATAFDVARQRGYREGRDAGADLCEALLHYSGSNVQDAMRQIVEQIRALTPEDKK